MASTRASISKASKKPKINIIPPKQLFVDLTHDDTKTPSPTLQLSSSSIDYIPKSPTSSTSLSPNGYLNSPTSPPPRVSPPPPTQENASMDITLTLSPITPLDVQFDTPSPSPPIFGHPIPWNLLEAHGDSCLSITTTASVRLQCCKASKKQTCITGSTMKSEFMALAAAGKEAECGGEDSAAQPLVPMAGNEVYVIASTTYKSFLKIERTGGAFESLSR
ncbi:hypothetical protein Tco_1019209 [Tanacetum coccineum]|uniref:Uncharacterized protein n=1 Tax=Tanacetum coccineum TaxID=301880 RepID=A0ABQ5FY71_9ASTR